MDHGSRDTRVRGVQGRGVVSKKLYKVFPRFASKGIDLWENLTC